MLKALFSAIQNHFPERHATGHREKNAPGFMSRTIHKMVRERLHRQETNVTPALMVVMMLVVTGFGSPAKADLYITGVDNGTTTTIRFSGSLLLFGPTFTNVVAGQGALRRVPGPYDHLGLMPPSGTNYVSGYEVSAGSDILTLLGFYHGVDFDVDSISHSGDTLEISGQFLTVPSGYTNGSTLTGETVFDGTNLPIDLTTPRTLTLTGSDSKIFFNINPNGPSVRFTAPRKSYRYRNRLTVRGTSTEPLKTLHAKWSGTGFRYTHLGGATTWKVKVPRRILKKKRSVTVSVRGRDAAGNISSIVNRRYKRR